MLKHTKCKYPERKGTSGYVYGCRCGRCIKENSDYYKINNYKYKHKKSEYHKKWYQRNKLKYSLEGQKLKQEVFSNYGGAYCKCCGELNIGFLTLDHTYNNGKIDRAKFGLGQRFYRNLKIMNFPNRDYQVLCFNCNLGRSKNKNVCPHDLKTKIKVQGY